MGDECVGTISSLSQRCEFYKINTNKKSFRLVCCAVSFTELRVSVGGSCSAVNVGLTSCAPATNAGKRMCLPWWGGGGRGGAAIRGSVPSPL